MVTTTDTTEIITQPKMDEVIRPSVKRWLKHLLHMPASQRFFNQQDQYAIAQAVREAEQGHVGEIQVVIEGHMPAREAYYLDTRGRAKQLFAELGVWDTALNSGILLYLNICERKVEIVIDRGIEHATTAQEWEAVCKAILAKMAQREYRQALVAGVIDIGQILTRFYEDDSGEQGNELGDRPIMLN